MRRIALPLIVSLLIPAVSVAYGQPGAGRGEQSDGKSSAERRDDRGTRSTTTTIIRPGVAEAAPQAPVFPVNYVAPLRGGAPTNRLPGGSRGTRYEALALTVLTPDHVGLTVAEQPSLYWYTSSAISDRVEMTIVDPRVVEPVLELQLAPPIPRGVHRLSLAEHGVRLAPGVDYRWNVAVVIDPSHRSKDILFSGAIKRVEPPGGLDAEVAKAGADAAFAVYAQSGLWYDALASLFALIASRPDDAALRRHLASLLAQVNLPEVGEDSVATGTPR